MPAQRTRRGWKALEDIIDRYLARYLRRPHFEASDADFDDRVVVQRDDRQLSVVREAYELVQPRSRLLIEGRQLSGSQNVDDGFGDLGEYEAIFTVLGFREVRLVLC